MAISQLALAQTVDSARHTIRNGYIEEMSEDIGMKLALTNHIETFAVNTSGDSYSIYPNTSTLTRLFVNYRIISFSVGFAPNFFPGNDDDAIKGKTKSKSFGFSLNFRRWFTDLSYSRTRGYYLENTKDFRPGWATGDAYIQFPDLQATSFEGMTSFNFNPKLSQSAITTQTERQLKSAGSFIPLAFYRYYIVDDQSNGGTTQMTNNFQFMLGAGYHYTFVMKNDIYLSAGATPAIGYVFTRLTTRVPGGQETDNSSSPVFHGHARVGAGYNGRRFFAGGYFSVFGSEFKQQHTTAVNTEIRTAWQLFFGYRVEAPGFLRKSYDKTVKQVIP